MKDELQAKDNVDKRNFSSQNTSLENNESIPETDSGDLLEEEE